MVVPTSQVTHGLFARRQLRFYGLRGKVLIDWREQHSRLCACLWVWNGTDTTWAGEKTDIIVSYRFWRRVRACELFGVAPNWRRNSVCLRIDRFLWGFFRFRCLSFLSGCKLLLTKCGFESAAKLKNIKCCPCASCVIFLPSCSKCQLYVLRVLLLLTSPYRNL